jgi:hypothetical protein
MGLHADDDQLLSPDLLRCASTLVPLKQLTSFLVKTFSPSMGATLAWIDPPGSKS